MKTTTLLKLSFIVLEGDERRIFQKMIMIKRKVRPGFYVGLCQTPVALFVIWKCHMNLK
jgi:hypothetical protein